MTASFREKTGKFLLFILGSLWGYLWVQEILSCPEWWFIGTNVLLIGAGICTAGKIPGICRRWIPALFIMLIFALPVSDLRSILLPFFFGLWYGGEEEVFDNWKISRTFCGGLFFGGIFSGISWLLPFWSELRLFLIPALVILALFNSVLNKSWIYKSAMLLAGIIFIWFSLPDPPSKPENIDSGTVAVAFGLVENGGEGQPMPKISFIDCFTKSKSLFVKMGISEFISSIGLSHHLSCNKRAVSSSSKRCLIGFAGLPATMV